MRADSEWTAGGETARPVLIRHNDYSPLEPPPLGGWTPTLPVSVVVPAHGGQHRLDLALAALAAQTYPAHLLEVVVVDDGSEPPLRLPEIVPERTRVVRADSSGWGISHAVNTGAAVADGALLQRLDADMVTCREHIEALARWHHLAGHLVTIGAKRFVEPPPLTPARVHEAVRRGGLGDLVDLGAALPSSTEETIARTNGLRASRNPYHVCTGPTVCLPREVFRAVGGLDPDVLRGEDTEFAYRLATHGVVFIPDMAAQAVHLGLPAQRRARETAVRAVAPYLAHRVPLRRDLRKDRGRRWLVPYVEIVLDVSDATEDQVRAAVSAALEGTVQDVVVTLVGPWAGLPAGRRPVLDDPDMELRLMRERFSHDERVRLLTEVARTPAPIPFRCTLPVGTPLAPTTLERMIETMQRHRSGMVVVEPPGGGTARLERTEALSRAVLLGADGPDETARTIEATHGVRHASAAEFWPATPKKAPRETGASTASAPSARVPQERSGTAGAVPRAEGEARSSGRSGAGRRRSLLRRIRARLRVG